jgi:sugar phosphate isomerase/epimerase
VDNSLCWGTVMGTPLRQLITTAAEVGFGAVTITPQLYFEARQAGASDADLLRWLDESGVRITLLDPLMSALPGSPEPSSVGPTFRALFEATERDCFRVAEALAIPAINVAHFQASPAPLEELVESFAGLCDRASRRGFRVLLEFMPEGSVADLATALRILHAADPADAAVMLDTWHFYRTGGTTVELQQYEGRDIGGLQVSDALPSVRSQVSPGLNSRLLPGLGVVPLREIVSWVLAARPDAFVGVEVFNAELAARPPQEAAREAFVHMAELLAGIESEGS